MRWNEADGGWRWMMVGMWGLREEMGERGLYGAKGKMRGGNDLKKGHVRPLNVCARSHHGALDLTRAEACIVCV